MDLAAVYSPNVKPEIVRRAAAAGVGRAELTCACAFLDRHAEAIRSLGGFRVVFADVFGGYANGAGTAGQRRGPGFRETPG